jgi:phage protein D
MSSVKIPDFKITWNGKATDDLKGQVAKIVFEDYEHGRADNVEITFQDAKKDWAGDWYPVRGDEIKLELGYKGEALADCGKFEIDEIAIDYTPNTLTVRARSAFPSKAFAQENTHAYKDTSLEAIAKTIAAHHKLSSEFSGEDVKFKILVQKRESDTAFLKRLAEKYGFIFKITDKKLILYERKDVEKRKEVATLKAGANHRLSLRETSTGEVKKTKAAYWDWWQEKLIESTETSAYKPVATDERRLYERVEDAGQSKRYAEAARRLSDYKRVVDTIFVREQQNLLLAGVTIKLQEFKEFDGLYFVECARHTMTGTVHYETELKVKRVVK